MVKRVGNGIPFEATGEIDFLDDEEDIIKAIKASRKAKKKRLPAAPPSAAPVRARAAPTKTQFVPIPLRGLAAELPPAAPGPVPDVTGAIMELRQELARAPTAPTAETLEALAQLTVAEAGRQRLAEQAAARRGQRAKKQEAEVPPRAPRAATLPPRSALTGEFRPATIVPPAPAPAPPIAFTPEEAAELGGMFEELEGLEGEGLRILSPQRIRKSSTASRNVSMSDRRRDSKGRFLPKRGRAVVPGNMPPIGKKGPVPKNVIPRASAVSQPMPGNMPITRAMQTAIEAQPLNGNGFLVPGGAGVSGRGFLSTVAKLLLQVSPSIATAISTPQFEEIASKTLQRLVKSEKGKKRISTVVSKVLPVLRAVLGKMFPQEGGAFVPAAITPHLVQILEGSDPGGTGFGGRGFAEQVAKALTHLKPVLARTIRSKTFRRLVNLAGERLQAKAVGGKRITQALAKIMPIISAILSTVSEQQSGTGFILPGEA